MTDSYDIWVKGIVQGVGFRPFVYRLAKKHLISGWVLNAIDGVHIHAEGDSAHVGAFIMALSEEAPAASHVSEIDLSEVPVEGFDNFEIRFSDDETKEMPTLVSPDLATCDDCLHELFDENDRRFRYPFINCTNCGPRFTIIDALPYDRKNTSMREFPMDAPCDAEYRNPEDRRFHAQPNACFGCGPVIYYARHASAGTVGEYVADGKNAGEGCKNSHAAHDEGLDKRIVEAAEAAGLALSWGDTREASDALFAEAAEALVQGEILAVKGLGGFHLVCDAQNAEAVARLRRLKRRGGEAFAVMMRTPDEIRSLCMVNDVEEKQLRLEARPIVLLRKRSDEQTPCGVADGLSELGIMLPATPVQHLLIEDFAKACVRSGAEGGSAAEKRFPPMLVMTSGNIHDEPILTDDAEAIEKLRGIADGFMGNNRVIATRFDDSVLRVIEAGSAGCAVQMIRRARGYAPQPLILKGRDATGESPSDKPTIFATGPEQKNTFTFLRGNQAFVSQHIGDMENADAFDAWQDARLRFKELFAFDPHTIACDFHPEYLTTKWAQEQHSMRGMPLIQVQHHHAHIASAMAEHGIRDAVCGLAFDGTGYGADGCIWGGEVLLSNLSDYERFANFAYVPMPGGASAIKHPLRMAYGVLWAFDLLEHPAAQKALLPLGDEAQVCEALIANGLNTPHTSSVGRLFDAASALLGICTQPTYESEGAVLLEAAISPAQELFDEAEFDERYAIEIVKNTATPQSTAHDTSVVLFDARPTFQALLDDFEADVPFGIISHRFHQAFVEAIVSCAELVRALYDMSTMVLSGGVFMNRHILQAALRRLETAGFTVVLNRELPPNDGCASFGQAVVAWARTIEEEN